MKRLFAACVAVGLLPTAGATASATLWVNTQDLYRIVGRNTVPEVYTFEWRQEYDGSADPILGATLTIVADDVDNVLASTGNDEDDFIAYRPAAGEPWTDLGPLTQLAAYTGNGPEAGAAGQHTTTVFTLPDADAWLRGTDGFSVRLIVEDWWNMEIETATLTVERGVPVAVPAPPAVLLCLAGLETVPRRLRRRG